MPLCLGPQSNPVVAPIHLRVVCLFFSFADYIISYLLVLGVVSVRVVLEAVVSVDDGRAPLAAHREGVSNDTPLRLAVESHHLVEKIHGCRFLVFIKVMFVTYTLETKRVHR